MSKKHSIQFSIDGRLVAHMDLDGTLTIRHDHFTDEDNLDLTVFLQALDKWAHRREISHISKRGVNPKTFRAINALQERAPGKNWLPPLPQKENADD